MKKRVVGLLLTVTMLFSSVPNNIFADELTVSPVVELIDDKGANAEDVNTDKVNNNGELQTSSEKILQADLLSGLGYHGMELSEEETLEKESIQNVSKDMADMTADLDYDADSFVILADSEEEAREKASCYGASLVSYSYGVGEAKIDFSDENLLLESCDSGYKNYIPTDMAGIMAIAAGDNSFPVIYPNYIYHILDDSYENEDVLNATTDGHGDYYKAQWYHTTMNNEAAWAKGYTGKGVTVAVIDTGVDLDHEDMAGKIVDSVNTCVGYPIDSKNTSLTYPEGATADDDSGHGSNVAGIIASNKNSIGGTGVAYDAKIMAVKSLNSSGGGNSATVTKGINYAIEKKADVINMSLGGSGFDTAQNVAVQKAIESGIVVVAAAGNAAAKGSGLVPTYPAAYEGVIAVAALTPTSDNYKDDDLYTKNGGIKHPDTISNLKAFNSLEQALEKMTEAQKKDLCLAYFSQFYDEVCIAAPGNGMISCYKDGGYIAYSGTSQATPAVAGVVAMVLQANNSIANLNSRDTAKSVKSILMQTSVGESYSSEYGTAHCGLIDASASVSMAADCSSEVKAPRFSGYKKNSNGTIKSGSKESLAIESDNKYGTVYYTLDGSDPVTNPNNSRFTYDAPIPLDFAGKKTIKATVFNLGEYSPVTTLSESFEAQVEKLTLQSNNIGVLAGKSAKIIVGYEPEYAVAPKLTFESNSDKFIVNSKGVVKVSAKAGLADSATITVTDTVSGIKLTGDGAVKIKVVNASIDSISLPTGIDAKKGLTLKTYVKSGKTVRESYDVKGNMISANRIAITSSNMQVCSVTSDGKIVAGKSGKAKITIAANDGSSLKKSFTVKVVSPVTSIKLKSDTNFTSESDNTATIPLGNKGCKIKLKPILNESGISPSNKKIIYESLNPSIATVTSAGLIKPAKYARTGSIATIRARAADGYGATCEIKVLITQAVRDLYIQYKYNYRTIKTKNLKYTMDSGEVFSYGDIIYFSYDISGNPKQSYFSYLNPDDFYIEIYSNEDIIGKYLGDVSSLKAKNPGKATLTLKSRDGSNKKCKISVTVK